MNMRLLIILVLLFPIAICSAEETEIQGSYDIINLANKNPELVEALRKPYDLQQNFDQERQKTFGKDD